MKEEFMNLFDLRLLMVKHSSLRDKRDEMIEENSISLISDNLLKDMESKCKHIKDIEIKLGSEMISYSDDNRNNWKGLVKERDETRRDYYTLYSKYMEIRKDMVNINDERGNGIGHEIHHIESEMKRLQKLLLISFSSTPTLQPEKNDILHYQSSLLGVNENNISEKPLNSSTMEFSSITQSESSTGISSDFKLSLATKNVDTESDYDIKWFQNMKVLLDDNMKEKEDDINVEIEKLRTIAKIIVEKVNKCKQMSIENHHRLFNELKQKERSEMEGKNKMKR